MQLINLTPHRLLVIDDDGTVTLDLPAPTVPARIDQIVEASDQVDGVEIRTIRYGDPTDLPDPVAGVQLIVSRIVAREITTRNDLLFPDNEIRDDTGRIIGCRALARFPRGS